MAEAKYDKQFKTYLADLGAKIRELRDDLGLSTEQAAAKAGMSSGYWGMVERAAKQPSLQSLFRFAAALGVDVADLVAVGAARSAVLVKSRHRQVDQILEQATAGQVKAITACAKSILALKGDPELTGSGARARR